MTLPATLHFRGKDVPWCVQCDRQVDFVEWKTPVEAIHGGRGLTLAHTGEIIVVVECHGERWRASNWCGELED